MKKISNKELKKINGGFSLTTLIGVSALVAFIAGVIDGFVNPIPCGGEEWKN